jgi:hypothetical protein
MEIFWETSEEIIVGPCKACTKSTHALGWLAGAFSNADDLEAVIRKAAAAAVSTLVESAKEYEGRTP